GAGPARARCEGLEHGREGIAQVPVREDAHQTVVDHHRKLIDPVLLHHLPRVTRRIAGLHRDDGMLHPGCEAHRLSPSPLDLPHAVPAGIPRIRAWVSQERESGERAPELSLDVLEPSWQVAQRWSGTNGAETRR